MTDGTTSTAVSLRHHRPSWAHVTHREGTGKVTTRTSRPRWLETLRRWTVLALVAFALNMLWEFVQLPLYVDHEQLETSVLFLAAIDDAGLIVVAAFAAGFAHRRSRAAAWTVLLLGLLATAAVIEFRAVTTGRWAYAELMPTVGFVGLSPLLQLPLTGVLAVTLARPWWPPDRVEPIDDQVVSARS